MRSLLCFALFFGSLLGQTPSELDRTVRKLAPDLVDATVAVLLGGGSGSGVIVSPEGLVITAAHVTNKPGQSIKVLLSDGRELPATSLGVDHGTDGALLQINAPGPFPHRPYVTTKTYAVGDWVIATGHPGGPVIGRPAPVRLGRISEAGIASGFQDAITTSAMVISGDSGGPLFNLKGEVIGINSNISGSWQVNKHVPLPSIVAKWDALLAGESFGRAMQQQQDAGDLFNEPYAELRDRFEKAVEKYADHDPQAATLKKRPRLLDPHHMQALLNRWEPDPEADQAPYYGFRLSPLTPQVIEVIPDSPAAKAGLKAGDLIVSANSTPIKSTTSLGLTLKNGGPLDLVLHEGRALTITPTKTIRRKHFPQPVAGVIDMIVIDRDDDLPQRLPTRKFLAELDPIRDRFSRSVLPIKDERGRTLVHGTVIHEIGQLLTKASELKDREGLVAAIDGESYPIRVLSVDEENDLALIMTDAPDLVPVEWAADEPEVGQLLITPGKRQLITGITTQPARVAPKKGYEINHRTAMPSAYLGVSFNSSSPTPIIETIELGSPADKIGLLEGDEIIRFEGREVSSLEDLGKLLTKRTPGEKVSVTVRRGDEEITLEPILAERPASEADTFDRAASQRDGRLSSLSARGGPLNARRAGFPYALYHDQALTAPMVGTPLVNLEGKVIGINIARALRHRTLAIPALTVHEAVIRLRDQTSGF